MKVQGMELVILDSALKHRLTARNNKHCLLHFNGDILISNHPTKRLYAGFDHIGNALEIIAIEDNDKETLTVIHAMRLRKQFHFLLGGN